MSEPYRQRSIVEAIKLAPKRSWWRDLRCRAIGHDWLIVRLNPNRIIPRMYLLPSGEEGSLDYVKGTDAVCMRCGFNVIDADESAPSSRGIGASHDVRLERASEEDHGRE